MKKMFIMLCGLLLFSGLQASADVSSYQEEQLLEIVGQRIFPVGAEVVGV